MNLSGEAMKAARQQLTLSQNKVNELCGFPPARYAQIERGTKTPSPEEVNVISGVLKLNSEPAKEKKNVRAKSTPKPRNYKTRIVITDPTPEDIGADQRVSDSVGEGSGYNETPSSHEDGQRPDEDWG